MASTETNVAFETIKIIATAVLSGLFTYWITFKKDREEKKYHVYKELLEKVYTPIIKIINDTWIPGEGYEGLDEKDIDKVINVIEANIHIVEPRLESFAWMFKEELAFSEFANFDRDKKFFDYINFRYNYLRKKLYLPHDTQYFFWGRQISQIKRWKRDIGRSVRRMAKKIKKNAS